MEIINFNQDSYEVKITNGHGDTLIAYYMEEIDEHNTKLTYSEKFKGASISKDLNYKFITFLARKSFSKKAQAVISGIESLAIMGQ